MFVVPNTSLRQHSTRLAEREGHSMPHIPMVYERVEATPLHWEYHVLSIDTREQELPDATTLNELGSKGWILAGVVAQDESAFVTFYFARQSI